MAEGGGGALLRRLLAAPAAGPRHPPGVCTPPHPPLDDGPRHACNNADVRLRAPSFVPCPLFLSFTLTWVGVITIPTFRVYQPFHHSPLWPLSPLGLQGARRSPLTPEPDDRTHTRRCAAVVHRHLRSARSAPLSHPAPSPCLTSCTPHKVRRAVWRGAQKTVGPPRSWPGGGTRRLRRAATACAGRAFSPRDTPVCPRTALTAAHGPPCAAHHPPETPRHSRAAPALPQQSTRACGV